VFCIPLGIRRLHVCDLASKLFHYRYHIYVTCELLLTISILFLSFRITDRVGKKIQSEASGFSITSGEWTLCKVVNVLLEENFRQVLGLCLSFLSQCLNQVLTAKSIGVSPCNWKYYNKNQYISLRLCSVRAFVSRPLFLILLIIHSCKHLLSWIYFEQPCV
jgi:hypothetical protein